MITDVNRDDSTFDDSVANRRVKWNGNDATVVVAGSELLFRVLCGTLSTGSVMSAIATALWANIEKRPLRLRKRCNLGDIWARTTKRKRVEQSQVVCRFGSDWCAGPLKRGPHN